MTRDELIKNLLQLVGSVISTSPIVDQGVLLRFGELKRKARNPFPDSYPGNKVFVVERVPHGETSGATRVIAVCSNPIRGEVVCSEMGRDDRKANYRSLELIVDD